MKPDASIVREEDLFQPQDRPPSLDEHGNSIRIHPSEFTGRFRKYRSAVYSVLIVIFLGLPWISIGGHQAVLLDVPHRRFAIFGLTFWAHDAPILVFVIGGFALVLLFLTSVFGRVWCGWACPQTVFIDHVYRRLEALAEGDAHHRRKLDKMAWGAEKIGRRSFKWLLYLAASLIIAHSFLAYFVGVDELADMMRRSPVEHPMSFGVMLFATGLTLFDFGWFREQFCLAACPYGRLQSVLMDADSLAPLYDYHRGEPRRTKKVAAEGLGDCVNCSRCVQVCPTGIDIRRGLQMECIACTACIDACDEVMVKVNKPLGLIRYDSVSGMTGHARKGIGSRSAVYLTLLALVLAGFTYVIATRVPLRLTVNRAPDAPYTVLSGGEMVNHVRLHLDNMSFEDAALAFTLDPALPGDKVVVAGGSAAIKAGTSKMADAFITFQQNTLQAGRRNVWIVAHPVNNSGTNLALPRVQISLLGPVK